MIQLLAFIGFIFLLWFVSRALIRFGNFMNRLAEKIEDIAASSQSVRLPPKSKDIKDKIHIINGEDTEDEYTERIRREIDHLTS